ncbi:hypothetical protein [Nocardioides sp. zg-DK7169]|uniref:hypothetical protein n=1 Tax=Nocardioides sp. zg-DK7169 TaxID=2736600 RepID=UPI0015528D5D|nr:hypothetical protein [Nocardioides sp. zg-DK7169]NPC98808.1 hypothetical protein [Nocardioides sp. zg-DK7169]
MTYKRRTRLAAAVAGAVMLTATAAACGDDEDGNDTSNGSGESSESFADKPVEEIQDAALTDMKALDSVRMAGTITDDGAEMSLDLRLTTAGDCTGSISMDGAEAEIIGIGEDSYLRGSEEFWTQSAGPGGEQQAQAMIQMIGDKWAVVPGGGFSEICDLDAFLDNLDDDDASESDKDKGEVVGETELDGTPAVEIVSKEDDEETTVWIGSEEDKHYILKMEVVGGDEPGEFTFSEFNEPLDVQAPTKDEVVDLAGLGG